MLPFKVSSVSSALEASRRELLMPKMSLRKMTKALPARTVVISNITTRRSMADLSLDFGACSFGLEWNIVDSSAGGWEFDGAGGAGRGFSLPPALDSTGAVVRSGLMVKPQFGHLPSGAMPKGSTQPQFGHSKAEALGTWAGGIWEEAVVDSLKWRSG